MYRVIIAGGRNFSDYALLEQTVSWFLSGIQDDVVILCGKARGADALGERYAQSHGHQVHYFPADWALYGRAAGCIRNEQMAQNADALIAFWDGASRGTKNMIDLARRYRLQLWVERYA